MARQKSPKKVSHVNLAFWKTVFTFRVLKNKTPMSVVQFDRSFSQGLHAPKAPRGSDFNCDLFLAVKRRCSIPWVRFYACYLWFDSADIQESMDFARRILGTRAAKIEHKMGQVFIERGLFPARGRNGYFTVYRS